MLGSSTIDGADQLRPSLDVVIRTTSHAVTLLLPGGLNPPGEQKKLK